MRGAAIAQGKEIAGYTLESFVQYSADNVDHITITLDASGTFHGIGNNCYDYPRQKKKTKFLFRKER